MTHAYDRQIDESKNRLSVCSIVILEMVLEHAMANGTCNGIV